jgi:hypothetical protein
MLSDDPILSLRRSIEDTQFQIDCLLLSLPTNVAVGERVRVRPEHRWATLPDVVFDIAEVVGTGADSMSTLKAPDGQLHSWFRAPELLRETDPLASTLENSMTSQTEIQQRADKFALSVHAQFRNTRDWAKAFHLAQDEDEDGATAYRIAGLGTSRESEPEPLLSLSVRAGETFDVLVRRYAAENNVPLRQAVHEVGRLRPDLAATR